MIDCNDVYLSGRITDVKYHTAKNGNNFASIQMVVNNLKGLQKDGKRETFPTFLSIMVFGEKHIKYLQNVIAKEGDYTNVRGLLTSTRKGNINQLSVLANDITIAKKDTKDTPKLDDVINMDEAMEEDF